MFTIVLELFILLILAAVVFLSIHQRSRKVQLIDQIPGPQPLPFVGNVLEFNIAKHDLLSKVVEFANRYGSIIRIWIGFHPIVVLSVPEYIEKVLSSNKEINKSKDYVFLQPWLGTGLLTSGGSKWHSRRKLLTPAFHFKILDDFVDIFNEQSSILADRLELEVSKSPIDICPFIALCTLDIICESAMGRHVNAQENSESDYVKAVYRISELIQHRQMKPWLQPDWLFKLFPISREHDKCLEILHGFTSKVYKERKLQFESKKKSVQVSDVDEYGRKQRLAFLDLLLEASQDGKVLSDDDICEEIDTFMFEGHDTTAAGISWTLFCLALHPEVQAKVHEELQNVFGDSDKPATTNDLQELKFLECCVKESLRLYPSVPFLARELKESIKFGEYEVPEGTTISIATYILHRNPKYFPEPEKFMPERFLADNVRGRHPYAYVPFSAGPRNCIGQRFALLEEKVVLSTVLRRFGVTTADRPQDLTLSAELILRSVTGMRLQLFKH